MTKKTRKKKRVKQYFEPRNKLQDERADELINSFLTRPLNKNTNCHSIIEQAVSNIDGVSNKEFYANRRNKQARYHGEN